MKLNQAQLSDRIKAKVTQYTGNEEPTINDCVGCIYTYTKQSFSRYYLQTMKNNPNGVSKQNAVILAAFLQIPLDDIELLVRRQPEKEPRRIETFCNTMARAFIIHHPRAR